MLTAQGETSVMGKPWLASCGPSWGLPEQKSVRVLRKGSNSKNRLLAGALSFSVGFRRIEITPADALLFEKWKL
jgi:hypothetical protein